MWRIYWQESDPSQLAPNERTRYDAMKSDEARAQFLACRVALRQLLAHYLNVPSAELHITCEMGEKPRLVSPPSKLDFSYSHTRALALIAIAANGPVGIDVEALDPTRVSEAIPRRHFSPEEQARVHGPNATAEFFRLWTAKEALLKATGEGLKGLGGATEEAASALGLTLIPLHPAARYAANVAAQVGARCSFFDYPA